jgi:hypothetical protein
MLWCSFLQYVYYTRNRAIIVALKEQTSMAVHDIAHSIGVSKCSVLRLLKNSQQNWICVPKTEGEMWTERKQHPELTRLETD